LFKLTYCYF